MSKRKRGKGEAAPVLNIKFARQDQAARQDELRKDMPAWTSDKEALKIIYNEVIRLGLSPVRRLVGVHPRRAGGHEPLLQAGNAAPLAPASGRGVSLAYIGH